MANYQTFMVDPLGALKPALGAAIQSELASLFKTVVAATKTFDGNTVVFTPGAANPTAHELLVYFMPSDKSVVKNVPNTPAVDLTDDGNTAFQAGASEVYVKSDNSALLARLAFHELMHNRLMIGNAMHDQGGMAAKTIGASTALSPANIKAMAAVLDKAITQWTQGIAILNNGKNDPMSEYYKI